MSDPQPMAMLEKRRIEAAMLKHVYETLKASHGIEVAQRYCERHPGTLALLTPDDKSERVIRIGSHPGAIVEDS